MDNVLKSSAGANVLILCPFSPNLILMHYFIWNILPYRIRYEAKQALRFQFAPRDKMHYIRHGAVSRIPGWY